MGVVARVVDLGDGAHPGAIDSIAMITRIDCMSAASLGSAGKTSAALA